MGLKDYWMAYQESVEEELYDKLERDPTYEEISNACTSEGFDDYCQSLEAYGELRHEA